MCICREKKNWVIKNSGPRVCWSVHQMVKQLCPLQRHWISSETLYMSCVGTSKILWRYDWFAKILMLLSPKPANESSEKCFLEYGVCIFRWKLTLYWLSACSSWRLGLVLLKPRRTWDFHPYLPDSGLPRDWQV